MEKPAASGDGGVTDRLSELPDCILEDILSRVTSRLAVQTSVLSRRWRHLWRAVACYCIDIDQRESRHTIAEIELTRDRDAFGRAITERNYRLMAQSYRFDNLADILTLPQATRPLPLQPLDAFRLRVFCGDFRAARSWIWRALERSPAAFHLRCDNDDPLAYSSERWPCFPDLILHRHGGAYTCRLRTVHLSGMNLSSDFGDEVIAECPVLEELHLEDCGYEFRQLASRSLKKLFMNRCGPEYLTGTLALAIPRIFSLHIDGRPPPITSEVEMPSLVSASLAHRAGDLGLLCSLRHARSLDLSGFSETDLLVDVPVFRNLSNLVLNACELGVECQVLRRFLRDAPSLQKLTIHNCKFRRKKRKRTSSYHEHVVLMAYPCKNLRLIELEFEEGLAVAELANALDDISKEAVNPIESSVQEGKRRVKISYK